MKVRLGTSNPVKVRAVRKALGIYFPKAVLEAVDVPSGVSPQPVSLGETLKGAKARAAACRGTGLGIGVESGLFRLDGMTMNVTICAVTDGRRTTVGGGPFFELPPFAVKMILKGDLELGEALARRLKIRNPARSGGAVGVLTRGRMRRADLVESAALMALAPWVASYLYRPKP